MAAHASKVLELSKEIKELDILNEGVIQAKRQSVMGNNMSQVGYNIMDMFISISRGNWQKRNVTWIS